MQGAETPKKTARRGRPSGRTEQGEATKQQLYEAAIRMFGEQGYEASTLRDIAQQAGVSPGLLYRYFPNKSAVVLTLYDQLSSQLLDEATVMPTGRWRHRFRFALDASLGVLAPHRQALRGLTPILVGDPEQGLFSGRTAFSRDRVQSVFTDAVRGASDAPKERFQEPLGRLLYLVHLAVILWWLLDRSPEQRSTSSVVRIIHRLMGPVSTALRFPGARRLVLTVDALVQEGLLGVLDADGAKGAP